MADLGTNYLVQVTVAQLTQLTQLRAELDELLKTLGRDARLKVTLDIDDSLLKTSLKSTVASVVADGFQSALDRTPRAPSGGATPRSGGEQEIVVDNRDVVQVLRELKDAQRSDTAKIVEALGQIRVTADRASERRTGAETALPTPGGAVQTAERSAGAAEALKKQVEATNDAYEALIEKLVKRLKTAEQELASEPDDDADDDLSEASKEAAEVVQQLVLTLERRLLTVIDKTLQAEGTTKTALQKDVTALNALYTALQGAGLSSSKPLKEFSPALKRFTELASALPAEVFEQVGDYVEQIEVALKAAQAGGKVSGLTAELAKVQKTLGDALQNELAAYTAAAKRLTSRTVPTVAVGGTTSTPRARAADDGTTALEVAVSQLASLTSVLGSRLIDPLSELIGTGGAIAQLITRLESFQPSAPGPGAPAAPGTPGAPRSGGGFNASVLAQASSPVAGATPARPALTVDNATTADFPDGRSFSDFVRRERARLNDRTQVKTNAEAVEGLKKLAQLREAFYKDQERVLNPSREIQKEQERLIAAEERQIAQSQARIRKAQGDLKRSLPSTIPEAERDLLVASASSDARAGANSIGLLPAGLFSGAGSSVTLEERTRAQQILEAREKLARGLPSPTGVALPGSAIPVSRPDEVGASGTVATLRQLAADPRSDAELRTVASARVQTPQEQILSDFRDFYQDIITESQRELGRRQFQLPRGFSPTDRLAQETVQGDSSELGKFLGAVNQLALRIASQTSVRPGLAALTDETGGRTLDVQAAPGLGVDSLTKLSATLRASAERLVQAEQELQADEAEIQRLSSQPRPDSKAISKLRKRVLARRNEIEKILQFEDESVADVRVRAEQVLRARQVVEANRNRPLTPTEEAVVDPRSDEELQRIISATFSTVGQRGAAFSTADQEEARRILAARQEFRSSGEPNELVRAIQLARDPRSDAELRALATRTVTRDDLLARAAEADRQAQLLAPASDRIVQAPPNTAPRVLPPVVTPEAEGLRGIASLLRNGEATTRSLEVVAEFLKSFVSDTRARGGTTPLETLNTRQLEKFIEGLVRTRTEFLREGAFDRPAAVARLTSSGVSEADAQAFIEKFYEEQLQALVRAANGPDTTVRAAGGVFGLARQTERVLPKDDLALREVGLLRDNLFTSVVNDVVNTIDRGGRLPSSLVGTSTARTPVQEAFTQAIESYRKAVKAAGTTDAEQDPQVRAAVDQVLQALLINLGSNAKALQSVIKSKIASPATLNLQSQIRDIEQNGFEVSGVVTPSLLEDGNEIAAVIVQTAVIRAREGIQNLLKALRASGVKGAELARQEKVLRGTATVELQDRFGLPRNFDLGLLSDATDPPEETPEQRDRTRQRLRTAEAGLRRTEQIRLQRERAAFRQTTTAVGLVEITEARIAQLDVQIADARKAIAAAEAQLRARAVEAAKVRELDRVRRESERLVTEARGTPNSFPAGFADRVQTRETETAKRIEEFAAATPNDPAAFLRQVFELEAKALRDTLSARLARLRQLKAPRELIEKTRTEGLAEIEKAIRDRESQVSAASISVATEVRTATEPIQARIGRIEDLKGRIGRRSDVVLEDGTVVKTARTVVDARFEEAQGARRRLEQTRVDIRDVQNRIAGVETVIATLQQSATNAERLLATAPAEKRSELEASIKTLQEAAKRESEKLLKLRQAASDLVAAEVRQVEDVKRLFPDSAEATGNISLPSVRLLSGTTQRVGGAAIARAALQQPTAIRDVDVLTSASAILGTIRRPEFRELPDAKEQRQNLLFQLGEQARAARGSLDDPSSPLLAEAEEAFARARQLEIDLQTSQGKLQQFQKQAAKRDAAGTGDRQKDLEQLRKLEAAVTQKETALRRAIIGIGRVLTGRDSIVGEAASLLSRNLTVEELTARILETQAPEFFRQGALTDIARASAEDVVRLALETRAPFLASGNLQEAFANDRSTRRARTVKESARARLQGEAINSNRELNFVEIGDALDRLIVARRFLGGSTRTVNSLEKERDRLREKIERQIQEENPTFDPKAVRRIADENPEVLAATRAIDERRIADLGKRDQEDAREALKAIDAARAALSEAENPTKAERTRLKSAVTAAQRKLSEILKRPKPISARKINPGDEEQIRDAETFFASVFATLTDAAGNAPQGRVTPAGRTFDVSIAKKILGDSFRPGGGLGVDSEGRQRFDIFSTKDGGEITVEEVLAKDLSRLTGAAFQRRKTLALGTLTSKNLSTADKQEIIDFLGFNFGDLTEQEPQITKAREQLKKTAEQAKKELRNEGNLEGDPKTPKDLAIKLLKEYELSITEILTIVRNRFRNTQLNFGNIEAFASSLGIDISNRIGTAVVPTFSGNDRTAQLISFLLTSTKASYEQVFKFLKTVVPDTPVTQKDIENAARVGRFGSFNIPGLARFQRIGQPLEASGLTIEDQASALEAGLAVVGEPLAPTKNKSRNQQRKERKKEAKEALDAVKKEQEDLQAALDVLVTDTRPRLRFTDRLRTLDKQNQRDAKRFSDDFRTQIERIVAIQIDLAKAEEELRKLRATPATGTSKEAIKARNDQLAKVGGRVIGLRQRLEAEDGSFDLLLEDAVAGGFEGFTRRPLKGIRGGLDRLLGGVLSRRRLGAPEASPEFIQQFLAQRSALAKFEDEVAPILPGLDSKSQQERSTALGDLRTLVNARRGPTQQLAANSSRALVEAAITSELTKQRAVLAQNRAIIEQIAASRVEEELAQTRQVNFLQGVGDRLRNITQLTFSGGIAFGIVNAFRQAVQESIKLEAEVRRIQTIFGGSSAAGREVLTSQVQRIAAELGVSALEIARSVQVFAQAGFRPDEVIRATQVSTEAQLGAGLTQQQAQDLLIATRSLTANQPIPIDFRDIVNRISRVESRNAVSAPDLATGLERVSAFVQQLQPNNLGRLDAQDLTIAAITQIVEKTRVTGNQAATSLKFIESRLLQPEISRQLNRSQAEGGFGVGLFADPEGKRLLPLFDIFRNISRRFNELGGAGSAEAQRLLQVVAGGRQAPAAAALFEDFDKVIATARESSGALGDTTRRTDSALKSLDRELERLGTSFRALGNSVFQSIAPIFEALASLGNKAFTVANENPITSLLLGGVGLVGASGAARGLLARIGVGQATRADALTAGLTRAASAGILTAESAAGGAILAGSTALSGATLLGLTGLAAGALVVGAQGFSAIRERDFFERLGASTREDDLSSIFVRESRRVRRTPNVFATDEALEFNRTTGAKLNLDAQQFQDRITQASELFLDERADLPEVEALRASTRIAKAEEAGTLKELEKRRLTFDERERLERRFVAALKQSGIALEEFGQTADIQRQAALQLAKIGVRQEAFSDEFRINEVTTRFDEFLKSAIDRQTRATSAGSGSVEDVTLGLSEFLERRRVGVETGGILRNADGAVVTSRSGAPRTSGSFEELARIETENLRRVTARRLSLARAGDLESLRKTGVVAEREALPDLARQFEDQERSIDIRDGLDVVIAKYVEFTDAELAKLRKAARKGESESQTISRLVAEGGLAGIDNTRLQNQAELRKQARAFLEESTNFRGQLDAGTRGDANSNGTRAARVLAQIFAEERTALEGIAVNSRRGRARVREIVTLVEQPVEGQSRVLPSDFGRGRSRLRDLVFEQIAQFNQKDAGNRNFARLAERAGIGFDVQTAQRDNSISLLQGVSSLQERLNLEELRQQLRLSDLKAIGVAGVSAEERVSGAAEGDNSTPVDLRIGFNEFVAQQKVPRQQLEQARATVEQAATAYAEFVRGSDNLFLKELSDARNPGQPDPRSQIERLLGPITTSVSEAQAELDAATKSGDRERIDRALEALKQNVITAALLVEDIAPAIVRARAAAIRAREFAEQSQLIGEQTQRATVDRTNRAALDGARLAQQRAELQGTRGVFGAAFLDIDAQRENDLRQADLDRQVALNKIARDLEAKRISEEDAESLRRLEDRRNRERLEVLAQEDLQRRRQRVQEQELRIQQQFVQSLDAAIQQGTQVFTTLFSSARALRPESGQSAIGQIFEGVGGSIGQNFASRLNTTLFGRDGLLRKPAELLFGQSAEAERLQQQSDAIRFGASAGTKEGVLEAFREAGIIGVGSPVPTPKTVTPSSELLGRSLAPVTTALAAVSSLPKIVPTLAVGTTALSVVAKSLLGNRTQTGTSGGSAVLDELNLPQITPSLRGTGGRGVTITPPTPRDPRRGPDGSLRPGFEEIEAADGTKQIVQTTAARLAGAAAPVVGQLLGGLLGRRNSFAPEGASIGSALGTAAGAKLFGSLGAFAGPVGAVAGGLLGGLFGGLFGKSGGPPPELQTLERIDRNTRETVTAIQNQTGLLTLDQRLLGVPASFQVPTFNPGFFGGGGPAEAPPTQMAPVTINIYDARDPDKVAQAAARELANLYRSSGAYVPLS